MTALDRNRDGLVSKSEIYGYFSYRLYIRDTNKDRAVDLSEMTSPERAAPISLRSARSMLAAFDANRDGRMSFQEIAQTLERSRTFEIMDLSRDGYLSPREMRIRGFSVY
jgi:Ca2+-binding EF-hand superfamily protein